jgi:hypothetical protein
VITVTVSKEHSQPIDTIVELTLDRDASKIAPVSIKAITPTQ